MASSFLQQRLYPTLRINLTAMVARGKRDAPLHVQQSDWDGACGTYCAAMALALLGRIADVSVLSESRKGVAARLWKVARQYYFDGVSGRDLAALLRSLDADLYVGHYSGSHRNCLRFTQKLLDAGRLVIVSWLSRNGQNHHWVLAVGVEGIQQGRTFTPQTFLVIDPGASGPQLCAYNGRLAFAAQQSAAGKSYIRYTSAGGWTTQVRLTSVVAVGDMA